MKPIHESDIELLAIEILQELGYSYIDGPSIAFDGDRPERPNYKEVILVDRLKSAVEGINKGITDVEVEKAVKKAIRAESPNLITNNQAFHKLLVDGVDVDYRRDDGNTTAKKVWLIDFEHPEKNEFLVVNQFTVEEDKHNRRPDIVIFINGIPLAVIELKNPADPDASVQSAYKQFETYKVQIPSFFNYNQILVISDGSDARAGTINSDWSRFQPWKTIDGKEKASDIEPQVEILLKGMFEKKILIDLIRNFIVYEREEDTKTKSVTVTKKIAAYHQYHAVNKAIDATMVATAAKGDKRAGVIWHMQGSGKSLIMAFYTGKLVTALNNPTVVLLTDRNDLDDQLFETFCRCKQLLKQSPKQADSREKLKEYLKVASGGIVFTTIQKFFPDADSKTGKYEMLSDRRNIVVICDEAHRSQYDFIDGFARHMRDALPNASFIGFTGTPIEKTDRNTIAVFGDYIDIYDIEQAVKDGATVKIYYESRLAKLGLKETEKLKIDPTFEEVTEGEEIAKKEKLKSKWARMEAIVGSEKRIKQVALDIVTHFEEREKVITGKAMIVCMSRRICVELHNEIVRLRPNWYNKDDNKGAIKVIMTGSASDKVEWQEHVRNKEKRRDLAERMKDPSDSLKIAIVRDMWLTGFDAPCLHTMYIDKPMKGHGLMQAIARVNRVFKDKPGGLIVDYLGIAAELKEALSVYTESGGKGKPAFDQQDAVNIMLEKYEVCVGYFHSFDYKSFFTASVKEKMKLMNTASEHVLKQKNGKDNFIQHVTALSKAFALAVPNEEALKIRDEVGFFQAVRARLMKFDTGKAKSDDELDSAVRQIISGAVSSDKVVDIFEAAGLKKPDISILSDEFLMEVRNMPHKNLAVELLKKLLNDEIKNISRKNIVTGRSFADMLEKAIKGYHNKTIEAAKIIEELIALGKKLREENNRGAKLNLSEDEIAFYDALETNDSAVKVLGDEQLRTIARELLKTIRKNTNIDWTVRENIQAKMRVEVKKILRKYGYPPDMQKKATELVLEQAKVIAKDWAENMDYAESEGTVVFDKAAEEPEKK